MRFEYVAVDAKGHRSKSNLTAETTAAAVKALKSRNLVPLRVRRMRDSHARAPQRLLGGRRKVKGREVAVFTHQLAVTLRAGLMLTEALEVVGQEMQNKYFERMIREILRDIQGGSTFSAAIARYPAVFSKSYRSIVRTGEATGKMHVTIANLADYLANCEKIREKVKSAMGYPIFVLCFAGVILFLVMFFLIPQFQEMYRQAGTPLPLMTQEVIRVSGFVTAHWMLFAVLLGATVGLIRHALKFPRFRRMRDIFLLRIPFVGSQLIHKLLINRFCRNLGTMMKAGVPLNASLNIAGDVTDHALVITATNAVKDKVLAGGTMAGELRRHRIFPAFMTKMVAVGERTGNISEMLERTADYYEEEFNNGVTKLIALVEPTMIIIVGMFVCVIVVALYLPIFNISSLVK